MDGHFKPIGGMFQGVRGSTAVSSGPADAKKLVMLDGNGKIDFSCLDDDLRDAKGVSERLDEEIQERREADLELKNGLSSLSDTVDEDRRQSSERDDILQNQIDSNHESETSSIAALAESLSDTNASLSEARSDISSLGTGLESATEAIGSLNDGMSSIRSDIVGIKSDIDGMETTLSQVSSDLDRNNLLLDDVKTTLARTSVSLLDLTTRLVTDEQAIKTLQEYVVVKFNSAETRLDIVEQDIQTIKDVLKDLIDKAVPN